MPVISTQGNTKLKTEPRKTENTKKHLVPPLSFEILVLQEKVSQPYGFSIDF
jgi:hypothetical protein